MKQAVGLRIVIFICLLSLLALSISAEEKVMIKLSGTGGYIGETAKIALTIDNNPGTVSGKFVIKYDKTLLEFTSYTVGEVLKDATVSVTAKQAGEIVIVYTSQTPITTNGRFVNISAKILSSKYPTIPLSVTVNHLTGSQNGKNPEITYQTIDSSLSVKQQQTSNLKGDVNGDNVVNEEDKQILISYILKRETSAYNMDINKDGHSDITDLSQLIILIG